MTAAAGLTHAFANVPIDLRAQGDGAIRLAWPAADLDGVSRVVSCLAAAQLPGVLEIVPGYATVTVFYDSRQVGYAALCAQLKTRLAESATAAPIRAPRCVEIPVWYGAGAAADPPDDPGPDLADVARHARLSVAEIIALHSGTEYTVAMIGFQPGFPYLAGLSTALHTPRLAQPRLRVPAGSVGIGGTQTGVYPFEAPGGWRLIGRTPQKLFDATLAEPCLCRAGDSVRFKPISREEFHDAGR